MQHVKMENKSRAITILQKQLCWIAECYLKCLLNSHLIYACENMMNLANENGISISGNMLILLHLNIPGNMLILFHLSIPGNMLILLHLSFQSNWKHSLSL